MYMYFKEYILPLWYFSVPIIFLLCSIYYFLYRILVARKLEVKKRMRKTNFIYLYLFIGALLIAILLLASNNTSGFLGILLIGQGFWVYEYDFISNEGLFIKGRVIPWDNISNLDYKNNKAVVLSYFKNNQPSKISKVTFNIGYDSRLELENTLKDKQDNTNIINVMNGDKIYSFKNIKIGLSLVLIFLTMVFVYGVYNLLQPKSLGVVIEKNFNHSETSTLVVHYPNEVKEYNMSTTSKEEEIAEIKNYLNSVNIRKIQFKDIRYKYMYEDLFEITLYKLNGEKVEIFISKEEPIIEIIRDNKKRSYFIEEGYKVQEFISKFGKSID
jgi:hypothetical protein